MMHPQQHISDLVEICYQKGIIHIIISPGSRNAPLIQAFTKRFGERCLSIVDERSAAYYACGIARYSGKPVIILCTSGTAALNYSPGLAEAYYEQLPVIAITADRPPEWIDQLDNQTIRQQGIYKNYIRAEYHLPKTTISEDDLWYVHRSINEAIHISTGTISGPVHINIPLAEPLYNILPPPSKKIRYINTCLLEAASGIPETLLHQWDSAERIMIIHGQDNSPGKNQEYFHKLLKDPRVVIIAENISNVHADRIISCPDLLLSHAKGEKPVPPDLLIYSGLQVVSKRLKNFLRHSDIAHTWRIQCNTPLSDTYQHTNQWICSDAVHVYEFLSSQIRTKSTSGYQDQWYDAKQKSCKWRDQVLSEIPFSDLKVMNEIMKCLPDHSIAEIGNSSIIRYTHFMTHNNSVIYYSNRGVSGIDGCLSAAIGTALVSGKLTTVFLGDLSFVYDSNALWNNFLPDNLRVVVFNNSGGGIFSLMDGPSKMPGFETFFRTKNKVNLQKLAEAFHLDYFCADDDETLKDCLDQFFDIKSKARLLEVITSEKANVDSFRSLIGGKN